MKMYFYLDVDIAKPERLFLFAKHIDMQLASVAKIALQSIEIELGHSSWSLKVRKTGCIAMYSVKLTID